MSETTNVGYDTEHDREIERQADALLDRYPVTPYLDSRESFLRWVHFVHNKVNADLHKDDVSMTQALNTYYEHYKPREISIIEGDSAGTASQFADDSLDGVFIDAAHDYASAQRDIEAWLPKVKKGGFFGGHDADSPGVSKALESLGIEYNMIGRCWIKQPEKQ